MHPPSLTHTNSFNGFQKSQTNGLHPPEHIDWISNFIEENKPQQARNRFFFHLRQRPPTLAQNYATSAKHAQLNKELNTQRRSTERQQREIFAKMLKEYGEMEDFYENVPLKQEEEKHKLDALNMINLNAFQTGIITRTKYQKEKDIIDQQRKQFLRKYGKIQQEQLLWKGKFDRKEERLRHKFNSELARMDRRIEQVQKGIDEVWERINEDVEWYRTEQDLSGFFREGKREQERGRRQRHLIVLGALPHQSKIQ